MSCYPLPVQGFLTRPRDLMRKMGMNKIGGLVVIGGVILSGGGIVGNHYLGGGGASTCSFANATGCTNQAGLTIVWNNPTVAKADIQASQNFIVNCTGSIKDYRPAAWLSNNADPDFSVTGSGYPVKWVFNYPNNSTFPDTSLVRFFNGCNALDNPNHATQPDLVVQISGDGINYGAEGDALKYNDGSHDINITGQVNCGPGTWNGTTGNHQDGIQLLGGDKLGFYDVTVGDWNNKSSTCEGNGGAFFLSSNGTTFPTNVTVERMKGIACSKGLNANALDANSTGVINNSLFRAGNPAERTVGKANGIIGMCSVSTGAITSNVPTNVPLMSFTNTAGQNYPYTDPFDCTHNQTTCLNVVGSPTGNVFVSSTGNDAGSNCVRFASRVAFPSPATSVCRTMDRADALLLNGDQGWIAGGTYPGQTITQHTTRTAKATLSVIPGQTMTLNGITMNSRYLDMIGPFAMAGSSLDFVNANDNVLQAFQVHDVSLQNFTSGIVHMRASNMTFKDGVICCNSAVAENGGCISGGDDGDGFQSSAIVLNSGGWMGTSNLTLDNITIHDIDRWNTPGNPASGACTVYHTDGIQLFGCSGCLFTNLHIYRTATSYILAKPESGATLNNITVSNSMFGNTLEGGNGLLFGDAGQTCGPNITVQNNTFGGDLVAQMGCAGSPGIFRNNAVAVPSYVCSGSLRNFTYSYNTFSSPTGTGCSSTSNAQVCTPTFSDSNRATNGNYTRLSSDTCATNKGDPANFTTPDIFGIPRPVGAAPDAAADEY